MFVRSPAPPAARGIVRLGSIALLLVLVVVCTWIALQPSASVSTGAGDPPHRANALDPEPVAASGEERPLLERRRDASSQLRQPVTLRVAVATDEGYPLSDAWVGVDTDRRAGFELAARTNRQGVAELILHPDWQDRILVTVTADGCVDDQRAFRMDGQTRMEANFFLVSSADLLIQVEDPDGRRAPHALVRLSLRRPFDDSRPLGAESRRRSVQVDDSGQALVHGLVPGTWVVEVDRWRDYRDGVKEAVEVPLGSTTHCVLRTSRWNPDYYSSGELTLGSTPDSGRFYLRRVDRPYDTINVYEDGAFFVPVRTEPAVELQAISDGQPYGEPFLVVRGEHGYRIDLHDAATR